MRVGQCGAATLLAGVLAACRVGDAHPRDAAHSGVAASLLSADVRGAAARGTPDGAAQRPGPFAPNRMGYVPVFEYHVIAAGPNA